MLTAASALYDKGTVPQTHCLRLLPNRPAPFLSIGDIAMKILCIGDIVGRIGRDMLFKYVDELKYQANIDFVIANGENSKHGRGMSKSCYNEMKRAGVDAFTMGNHIWGSRDVISIMENEGDVIRPANWAGNPPGQGSVVLSTRDGIKIGILNLMGQVDMIPCDNPFAAAQREIAKLAESTPIILVDFHAEATSEKIAMGWFLDGKVSAVFGTHTHVQTADDKILPGGTGYISDLGMTGPADSVLGMDRNIIMKRFTTGMPQKFEIANGRGQFCGIIFTIDEGSGKCTGVERLYFEE